MNLFNRWFIGGTTGVVAASLALATTIIRPSEGLAPRPYKDVVGVYTDCYGNTKNVKPNLVRTKSECEALLADEGKRIAEKIVSRSSRPIPPHRLASFISFAYNVGDTAFLESKLFRMHNEGKGKAACKELFQWVYAGGKKLRGLVTRREAEYRLCMGQDPAAAQ